MALIKLTLKIYILLLFAIVKADFEPVKKICHEECTCQNTNDVLLLNCTNSGLTNILNEWPEHKNQLIVSFSYNNFSELQQMPSSDAKSISLSFSHCGIKSLVSALFIDAVGIEYLDLSWNLLTGREIHADVFRGRYSQHSFEPISLLHLDLSHNYIESLLSSTFEHTPRLQKLVLSHNPLHVIDPQTSQAISSLLQLKVLQMANASLEKIPTEMFSRLRRLEEVDISGNKMKRVPEGLEFLSASLEKLNLAGNLMEHLEDHEFMGMHKLKELNISGMSELRTIRHNTFAFLPELKVLYCENNRYLFHIHENAFGIDSHIPPLQDLFLSNNDLHILPLSLLNWSSLHTLSLSGNRWNCDCQLLQTLSTISNVSTSLLSPEASCSSPLPAAGTALEDLESLEKLCRESGKEVRRIQGAGDKVLKAAFVIALVLLVMVAGFVFWRVVARYNNIRAMNTMFPVMYVSAPTTED